MLRTFGHHKNSDTENSVIIVKLRFGLLQESDEKNIQYFGSIPVTWSCKEI